VSPFSSIRVARVSRRASRIRVIESRWVNGDGASRRDDSSRDDRDPDLTTAEVVTGAELDRLALAADPATAIDPHAVAWVGAAQLGQDLLPEWYMPRPTASGRHRWTRLLVVSIIAGILLINAFGLCVTSGFISVA
jgi:hypothetical protein